MMVVLVVFLALACMVDLAEQEVHQVPGAALMLQHRALNAGQACHSQRLLPEPLVGLPQLLQASLPVTLKVPLRYICRWPCKPKEVSIAGTGCRTAAAGPASRTPQVASGHAQRRVRRAGEVASSAMQARSSARLLQMLISLH